MGLEIIGTVAIIGCAFLTIKAVVKAVAKKGIELYRAWKDINKEFWFMVDDMIDKKKSSKDQKKVNC